MTIAYSYLRLSSKIQLNGQGKTRQLEASRQAAIENGWQLSEMTFEDLGVSAYTGKNVTTGAFNQILRLIESGVIKAGSVLIVENPDRISREGVNESAALMLQILASGVQIYTIFDKKLYSGSKDTALIDLLMWGVQAQRAYDESKTKSKRVRDARKRAREKARAKGKSSVTVLPSWLRRVKGEEGDTYEIIEEKANLIRQLFKLKLRGYGYVQMNKELEKMGLPYVHTATIVHYLKSQSVIGIYQPITKAEGEADVRIPVGDPIENFYPPIVDRETFFKVQAMFSKPQKGRVANKHFNLWRCRIKCKCGSTMHLQRVTKSRNKNDYEYFYLRCPKTALQACPNSFGGVDYPRFTKLALMSIDCLNWDALTNDSKLNDLVAKRTTLEGEKELLEKRIESLLDQLELTPSTFISKRLASLEEEYERINKELATTNHDVEVEESLEGMLKNESKGVECILGMSLEEISTLKPIHLDIWGRLDHLVMGEHEEGCPEVQVIDRDGAVVSTIRMDKKLTRATIESNYSQLAEVAIYDVRQVKKKIVDEAELVEDN